MDGVGIALQKVLQGNVATLYILSNQPQLIQSRSVTRGSQGDVIKLVLQCLDICLKSQDFTRGILGLLSCVIIFITNIKSIKYKPFSNMVAVCQQLELTKLL